MSDYSFLQLNASSVFYLEQLYEKVYLRKAPANYFSSKYNTTYIGKQYIGYIAMQDKLPVAFYGIIPTRVSVKKSIVLAAQSCDTMTHPKHRKNGLFKVLAEMTFELAKQNDIHFVFGFPNNSSHSTFLNHLGFIQTETLSRYTIHFKDSFRNRILRKLFFPGEKVKTVFRNMLILEGFDGVIYDEAFLKYKRYNQNLIVGIENNYYWINKYGNLFVGAISAENMQGLSRHIALLQSKTKAKSISFLISPDTKLNLALSEIYKVEQGFPVIIKDLSGKVPLDNLKFQFADIDIF